MYAHSAPVIFFLSLYMIQIPDYSALSPAAAVALQMQMREKINLQPFNGSIKLIGGAEISFNKFDNNVRVAIAVLSFPDFKTVGTSLAVEKGTFPFISGLVSFRQLPALIRAWNQLDVKPDVVILHGQGIAHKYRTGIAVHFGLITGAPAIGCAHSNLTGHFKEPENKQFATSPLTDASEQIGVVFRAQINCKPLFVSPGNKITLSQSVEIIKQCIREHCTPEPMRIANEVLKNKKIKKNNSTDQPTLF